MLTHTEIEIVRKRMDTYPAGIGNVWGTGPCKVHSTDVLVRLPRATVCEHG